MILLEKVIIMPLSTNLIKSTLYTCNICLNNHANNVKYFDCSKDHNLCFLCINTLLNSKADQEPECPMCRAKMLFYYRKPSTFTKKELTTINKAKILQFNIFIYQNFILNPNYVPMEIKTSNQNIVLYSLKGGLAKFSNLYICVDGFMYDYDEQHDCYFLAVKKDKFQFWDFSRIRLNI